ASARTGTLGAIAVAVTVALLVGRVEALDGLGRAGGIEDAGRQLHGHLPRLPEVAEVSEADQATRRLRDAFAGERIGRQRLEPRQVAVEDAEVEPSVALHGGLDVVVLEVDGEETEGRDRPRRRRDQGSAQAQEVDEPTRLEGPGAAEG